MKNRREIDSENLEHSVRGYGQMTWDNVSQWCVRPSIHPNCPSSRTNRLEIALHDQSEESCILQDGIRVHMCRYMSSPAVIYILSNVSAHVPGPGLKVLGDLRHGRIQVSSLYLFNFCPSFIQPSS